MVEGGDVERCGGERQAADLWRWGSQRYRQGMFMIMTYVHIGGWLLGYNVDHIF